MTFLSVFWGCCSEPTKQPIGFSFPGIQMRRKNIAGFPLESRFMLGFRWWYDIKILNIIYIYICIWFSRHGKSQFLVGSIPWQHAIRNGPTGGQHEAGFVLTPGRRLERSEYFKRRRCRDGESLGGSSPCWNWWTVHFSDVSVWLQLGYRWLQINNDQHGLEVETPKHVVCCVWTTGVLVEMKEFI